MARGHSRWAAHVASTVDACASLALRRALGNPPTRHMPLTYIRRDACDSRAREDVLYERLADLGGLRKFTMMRIEYTPDSEANSRACSRSHTLIARLELRHILAVPGSFCLNTKGAHVLGAYLNTIRERSIARHRAVVLAHHSAPTRHPDTGAWRGHAGSGPEASRGWSTVMAPTVPRIFLSSTITYEVTDVGIRWRTPDLFLALRSPALRAGGFVQVLHRGGR